jgi:hypothetical protein
MQREQSHVRRGLKLWHDSVTLQETEGRQCVMAD